MSRSIKREFSFFGRSTGAAAAAMVFALCSIAPQNASADRRVFGYSYPYMTLPAGGFEVEQYLDATFAPTDDPATEAVEDDLRPSWRHQVELEYAITDHLDFGFYNVFRQRALGEFEYRGIKVRSRYRFGERGDWFIDPAIYGEVAYYGDEVKLEEIIILSRMVDPVEIVLNLKFEEEFAIYHDAFEFEFVPSLGVAYHFNEAVALAAEYTGVLEVEDGEAEEMQHFAGPAFSLATEHFWWTLAAQIQLHAEEGAPDLKVRSIFAIML